MPFLVPQLATLGDNYDGTKPLPARLERIARLDADFVTTREIAKRQQVSVNSVCRLRRHEAYAARRTYLAQRAAERAARESPLSYKGNRIAMLDRHARKLAEDLLANDYRETIAVDKQGKAITGFDRGRAAELTKTVMAIDSMTEPKRSTIADTTNVAVQVTMTTEQAVTKVQALLSRASALEERAPTHAHAHAREADPQASPMPSPLGVEGGISGTDTLDEDGAVPDREYTIISGAKDVLEAEYTNFSGAKGGEE